MRRLRVIWRDRRIRRSMDAYADGWRLAMAGETVYGQGPRAKGNEDGWRRREGRPVLGGVKDLHFEEIL